MKKIIIFITLLLLSTPSKANDSFAGTAVGGIYPAKSDVIKMNSEDLYISPKKIKIKYKFQNTSDKKQDITIYFPIPPYGVGCCLAGRSGHEQEKEGRPNFKFTVLDNGKKINDIKQENRAFLLNRDENGNIKEKQEITEELKKLNLPVTISSYPDFGYFFTEKLVKELGLEKYITCDVGYTNDFNDDDNKIICFPKWSQEDKFYWSAYFKPKEIKTLEHEYEPLVGAFQGFYDTDKVDYCISDKLEKMFKEKSVIIITTEYILTSESWKNGNIENFHLTIDKTGYDYVSLCFDGLKKTSENTFEVSKKNFKPEKLLKVMFILKRNY